MAMENYSIKTVNGDFLYGHKWIINNAKANLVIVTGMAEALYRYDEFAKFLNDNNINVYGIDHYGQGENVKNEKDLGRVPTSFFSKTVRNTDDVVKSLKNNKLPTYVLGHSMGSFIIQDYIQRFASSVQKVVIVGTNGPNFNTMFKLGFKLAKIIVHKSNRNKDSKFLENLSIGSYPKKVKNRKTNCDWLSYNEENVAKYINDPKCGYVSSNGFYYELLKGNARLYKKKFLKKISHNIKILIIAGKDDPVGAMGKGPSALSDLYKELGVKDVSLKIYDNMRHEILNENNKEIVYQNILDFLNK